MRRANHTRGIVIISVAWRDGEKGLEAHHGRRPKAIASAKVGHVLRYQAARRTPGPPGSISRWVVRGMSEERRNRAGVVRAMARSFPGRWGARPRGLRASSHVPSMGQRRP